MPQEPKQKPRPLSPAVQEALLKPVRVAAQRLPEARAAARRLGLPLTVADVRPNPPTPNAENAAPFYRQLTALYEKQGKEKALPTGWDDARKVGPTPENLRAARQAVARSGEILRLAEAAAAKPRCDFAPDWNAALDAPIPQYAAMRHAVRLFAIQALLSLEAGKPLEAIPYLERCVTVARHAGSDSLLISHLVRIALLSILYVPFDAVLKRYGTRADILPLLGRLQARTAGLEEPRYAFRGECFCLLPYLEACRRGDSLKMAKIFDGSTLPGFPVNPTPQHYRLFADAWEARHLEFWAAVLSDGGRSGATLRQRRERIANLATEQERRFQANGRDLSYVQIAILSPVLPGVMRKVQQVAASARLHQAALMALDARRRTGRYPAFLSVIPLDPFTDRPLYYRPEGHGLLLYSTGPNGKDEGGNDAVDETPDSRGFTRDIVLRLPG